MVYVYNRQDYYIGNSVILVYYTVKITIYSYTYKVRKRPEFSGQSGFTLNYRGSRKIGVHIKSRFTLNRGSCKIGVHVKSRFT